MSRPRPGPLAVTPAQVARANRENLNVEGSFRHLVTDFFAFAATVVAGSVIWATGFDRADPIASLAVAASMLVAALPLLRRTGRVLLEAAPEGMRPEDVAEAITSHPGVASLHDLHVWEISSGFSALSAHVLVARDEDCHRIRRELEDLLHERFGLEHTTMQVEHTRPAPSHLPCDRPAGPLTRAYGADVGTGGSDGASPLEWWALCGQNREVR